MQDSQRTLSPRLSDFYLISSRPCRFQRLQSRPGRERIDAPRARAAIQWRNLWRLLDTMPAWRGVTAASLATGITAACIPEIIQACFGADCGHSEMKIWLTRLAPDEKDKRRRFTDAFKPVHETFRSHASSLTRWARSRPWWSECPTRQGEEPAGGRGRSRRKSAEDPGSRRA
jgi:hypothetical protein